MRLAESRLGKTDAADVAQAALVKVFTRASEFSRGRPCLPWFYAIVANEIRAARRRGARLTFDEEAVHCVADGRPDVEAQLISHELSRALDLAVAALDDDAANSIRAMLGQAPVPKVSASAFRKRVSRAYAKLRLALGGHDVG